MLKFYVTEKCYICFLLNRFLIFDKHVLAKCSSINLFLQNFNQCIVFKRSIAVVDQVFSVGKDIEKPMMWKRQFANLFCLQHLMT